MHRAAGSVWDRQDYEHSRARAMGMLGLALIAAGTALVGMGYKSQLASWRCRASGVLPRRSMKLDEVNKAADASFPASDPPAFTSVSRKSGAARKHPMIDRRVALATLILGVTTAASAQAPKFTPPRLLKAELAALPAPTIAGGGEVLIEATVDRTGVLTRPIVLRGTPPYTQMVLDAAVRMAFRARAGRRPGWR